jgi:hypothetical protein
VGRRRAGGALGSPPVNRSTQKTLLTSTPPLVGSQSRNGRRPTRSALLKEIGPEGASIPCSEATATGACVPDEGYGTGCLRPSETHKHLFLREKLQGRDTRAFLARWMEKSRFCSNDVKSAMGQNGEARWRQTRGVTETMRAGKGRAVVLFLGACRSPRWLCRLCDQAYRRWGLYCLCSTTSQERRPKETS